MSICIDVYFCMEYSAKIKKTTESSIQKKEPWTLLEKSLGKFSDDFMDERDQPKGNEKSQQPVD